MKNLNLIKILYCLPFAFMAVNGDAVSGTMFFYTVMVMGLSLLCWITLRSGRVTDLYVGNGISFLASIIAVKVTELDPMGYYFKPFTSHSLIIAISIVAVVIQTIVLLIYKSQKTEN